jgi:hypothetical protein
MKCVYLHNTKASFNSVCFAAKKLITEYEMKTSFNLALFQAHERKKWPINHAAHPFFVQMKLLNLPPDGVQQGSKLIFA